MHLAAAVFTDIIIDLLQHRGMVSSNAAIRLVHNSIFNYGKVARTTSLHCNLAESVRKAGLGLIECRIRLEVLRNNGRQVVALQETDPLAGGNSMIQHVYQSPMGCRFTIEAASLSRKVWSQVLASLGALDFRFLLGRISASSAWQSAVRPGKKQRLGYCIVGAD